MDLTKTHARTLRQHAVYRNAKIIPTASVQVVNLVTYKHSIQA